MFGLARSVVVKEDSPHPVKLTDCPSGFYKVVESPGSDTGKILMVDAHADQGRVIVCLNPYCHVWGTSLTKYRVVPWSGRIEIIVE